MSAAEALKAGRAAGIRLGIDGDALTLEASEAPSPAVLGRWRVARPAWSPFCVWVMSAGRAEIGWCAHRPAAAPGQRSNTRPCAAVRNRTYRPWLAAFALLVGSVRHQTGRGGRLPFIHGNLDMRTSQ
jgi:hypothetical protein